MIRIRVKVLESCGPVPGGETVLLLNNASRQVLVDTQLIATGHREVFPRGQAAGLL